MKQGRPENQCSERSVAQKEGEKEQEMEQKKKGKQEKRKRETGEWYSETEKRKENNKASRRPLPL